MSCRRSTMLAHTHGKMLLFLHLFFGPCRRFCHAVERGAFPEAAKELNQIRRIVAINLVLGLLTVTVGASGRFW